MLGRPRGLLVGRLTLSALGIENGMELSFGSDSIALLEHGQRGTNAVGLNRFGNRSLLLKGLHSVAKLAAQRVAFGSRFVALTAQTSRLLALGHQFVDDRVSVGTNIRGSVAAYKVTADHVTTNLFGPL